MERGALPPSVLQAPVEIDAPSNSEHGDLASNFALVAAKPAGMAPRAIAGHLAAELSACNEFSGCEVAGPGFLNLRLSEPWVADHLVDVGENFGSTKAAQPMAINVEFVSVNPNGPITIGSGRGAAFGSALCNVLEAAGHTVCREYYINDGVNSEQMRLFAESVKAIIYGRSVPENGYKGDYVQEVAAQLKGFVASGYPRTPNHIDEELRRLSAIEPRSSEEQLLFDRLTNVARDGLVEIADYQFLAESTMIFAQKEDLAAFNTHFDTWFSEQSLHDSGAVRQELHHLVASGVADTEPYQTEVKFAKGGAIAEISRKQQDGGDDSPGQEPTVWLRSTKFGDEKDRVLKRKDGRLTYIASDVAYHKDKFNRPVNADKLITVLGPDHHGYINRLLAVVAALHADVAEPVSDETPLTEHEAVIYQTVEERNRCKAALAWAKDHLEVHIFQLVRFLKDGKPAPMRKRDGNIYALIDLVNEIGEQVRPNGSTEEKQRAGTDVARFFYLMRHHDTTMDFDLELATKQSDENPVFYVQYAHARICSVIKKAAAVGLQPSETHLSLLAHPKEKSLALKVLDLPYEVERTAEDYAVNRLTTYATELARTYHAFYDSCRVIQPDQPELSSARLALCQAAQTALKNALKMLGISAPSEM